MAFEQDSKQIKCFAFEPVRGIPDIHHGSNYRWIVFSGEHAQAKSCVVLQGQQVVNHGESMRVECICLVEHYRLAINASAKSTVCRAVGRPFGRAERQVINATQLRLRVESPHHPSQESVAILRVPPDVAARSSL